MKSTDTKTHSQTHSQSESAAFFDQTQEHLWYTDPALSRKPFFPGSSTPNLQPKLISANEAPFFQTKSPIIQRMPGFESEVDPGDAEVVQRKAAFESEEANLQAKQLIQRQEEELLPYSELENQVAIAPLQILSSESAASQSVDKGSTPTEASSDLNPSLGSQDNPTILAMPQIQQQAEPELEESREDLQPPTKYLGVAAEMPPDPAGTDDPTTLSSGKIIQSKLIIGRSHDRHEQEADAIADRIVSMPVQEPVAADSEAARSGITESGRSRSHLQKQAITDQDNEVNDPQIESLLASTQAGGRPLEPAVLEEMETKFKTDFSHVRIHTDETANHLASRLSAQAFTHGNHIYFNANKYDPQSKEGKHLLAHELTHVIQQSGLQRKLIQRSPVQVSPTEFILNDGTHVDRTTVGDKRIEISAISLPGFKERNARRFPNVLAFRRPGTRNTDQGTHWRNSVRDAVQRHLQNMLPRARESGGYVAEGDMYFFKAKNSRSEFHLFGAPDELQEPAMVPFWDKDGQAHSFDIDHIVEDQLVNSNDPSLSDLTSADRASNFELLDSQANSSSGSLIAGEINRRLRGAIRQFSEDFPTADPLTLDGLRHGYKVNFLSRTFDLGGAAGEPNNYWTHREILQGQHLNKLEPLTGRELRLLNREDRPVIFTSAQGGERRFVREAELPINNWLPRVNLTGIELSDNPAQSEPAGWLTVDAFRADEAEAGAIVGSYEDMRWRLKSIPGVYGGAIDKEYFRTQFGQTAGRSLRLPGLSPIQLNNIDITQRGILAEGKVLPTVPMIQNADIDIVIDGRDVRLRKLFNLGEINVPPPFEINSANLEVFYGTRGLGASGDLSFAIQNVGEGRIGAAASTSGGFELEGEFNFDSNLFDPAQVQVTYRNNTFGVSGTIGIPEGKVRGIKSARITAAYSEGTFTANGEAELDIRGVERGTLEATYSGTGWSIGGTFNLSNEIPRIRSGSISVAVSKVAGQEGYQLTASGTAVPDIPGIDAQLSIEYDNGAISIQGTASYERDLLSGSIEVGATNRALDGEGQPTGEPTDTFIVYGGGSLTVQITPWLEGTVGVRFEPNGEIIVSGRIGLPSSIEVFRRMGVPERELFGIGIDIPIFAIPVGPRSIGLVASIRGGLKAHAGIGPGTLENLELGIEYNPARPRETHVTGGGRFVIPAEAGLSLFVRATIGLSAVIGGVEGGLELAGGLGLEAEASAEVNVDWTPETGLELNASLGAYVQPKFVFTIDGVIRAWLAFYEKEWRWRLADYEYGPDFRFGVRLPIHYREGEPFDISFDDIELTYPQIDPTSFVTGLIQDIRSSRDESD